MTAALCIAALVGALLYALRWAWRRLRAWRSRRAAARMAPAAHPYRTASPIESPRPSPLRRALAWLHAMAMAGSRGAMLRAMAAQDARDDAEHRAWVDAVAALDPSELSHRDSTEGQRP